MRAKGNHRLFRSGRFFLTVDERRSSSGSAGRLMRPGSRLSVSAVSMCPVTPKVRCKLPGATMHKARPDHWMPLELYRQSFQEGVALQGMDGLCSGLNCDILVVG